MISSVPRLDELRPVFPALEKALDSPPGLLASGGNLKVNTLIDAYSRGIFPWFNEDNPILWYSPDPRLVLRTDQFHSSRSLRKTLRARPWRVGVNQNFRRVIQACSRGRRRGTWLNADMVNAYQNLHRAACAHSVEVYDEHERLLGGLYGVGLGKMFFGESMFSHVSDASKVALHALCGHLHRHQAPLIDCQIYSEHLHRLGARLMRRGDFVNRLRAFCRQKAEATLWQTQFIEP